MNYSCLWGITEKWNIRLLNIVCWKCGHWIKHTKLVHYSVIHNLRFMYRVFEITFIPSFKINNLLLNLKYNKQFKILFKIKDTYMYKFQQYFISPQYIYLVNKKSRNKPNLVYCLIFSWINMIKNLWGMILLTCIVKSKGPDCIHCTNIYHP